MIDAMHNDIVFNQCLQCKQKFNIYDIQTQKHIDDIHEKYICAHCSDLELEKTKQVIRRRTL